MVSPSYNGTICEKRKHSWRGAPTCRARDCGPTFHASTVGVKGYGGNLSTTPSPTRPGFTHPRPHHTHVGRDAARHTLGALDLDRPVRKPFEAQFSHRVHIVPDPRRSPIQGTLDRRGWPREDVGAARASEPAPQKRTRFHRANSDGRQCQRFASEQLRLLASPSSLRSPQKADRVPVLHNPDPLGRYDNPEWYHSKFPGEP